MTFLEAPRPTDEPPPPKRRPGRRGVIPSIVQVLTENPGQWFIVAESTPGKHKGLGNYKGRLQRALPGIEATSRRLDDKSVLYARYVPEVSS